MRLFAVLLIILSSRIYAENIEPRDWGLAFGYRNARIPFDSANQDVADIVPYFYYERGDFEIHELSAKLTLLGREQWRFKFMGKYRFFDVPKESQNRVRADGFDTGFELEYKFKSKIKFRTQLLGDVEVRPYLNNVLEYPFAMNGHFLRPYMRLTLHSAKFNNRYYGLNEEKPGFGLEYGAGLEGRFHIKNNLSLIAKYEGSSLDEKTRDTKNVKHTIKTTSYLGIAFLKNKNRKNRKRSYRAKLEAKDFIRVSGNVASPSDVNELLTMRSELDSHTNTMASVAYGIPISDTLLTMPISLYLMPIIARHFPSDVQGSFNEYAMAIKGYYKVVTSSGFKWRIGFGEGLSYAEKITYIEAEQMTRKRYRGSKLLNYLDFSLDFNLASLGKTHKYKNIWVGAMIHHRSGVFEAASMFGKIKGGSNYPGLYIHAEI